MNQDEIWDFIIIGSGFGGSVSAMRLTQKGYRVLVLEEGRRWRAQDFPKTNWNIRKYLWAPWLGCFGIQAIRWLRGVLVLHGKGVGGGSLVYANTLMKPTSAVLRDSAWPRGIDWSAELAPHYDEARSMLGVRANPSLRAAERALQSLGEELGCGASFHPTEVGVHFSLDTRPQDPFFNGEGPLRQPCTECGGCMVGCRFGAKNTLDLNYLYFAEKWGARVEPEMRVTGIHPVEDGYEVRTRKTSFLWGQSRSWRSRQVIVAAGVLGSVELLLRCRRKSLPRLSPALGDSVRTNGESLLGATSFRVEQDFAQGIAIGAGLHPDSQTKIEAVKYPSGSSFMRLLAVPLTPDAGPWRRPWLLLGRLIMNIGTFWRLMTVKDWARQTVILLVMQSIDRTMRLRLGWFGRLKGSVRLPSSLPIAQKSAEILARQIGGEPQNVVSEVLLATPATAHILGGCRLGDDPATSVVDSYHQAYGHSGLFVCDGSVIPVNLGVNPSLTITALSERFCGHFPVKDQAVFHSRKIQFGPWKTP